ncbi:hypothetical protein [Chitinophaga nivalis]|uniref:Glycosyltransferase RgtA/B/C/D-like domain-containing protein n=1 Tax=Chitinophaga nivalis TaxID=2991709 RepID=A0ABT3IQD0_9BACT|nr:hypothetical protein [Chitinophaga nivalis]MCW3464123.1 hypothetical protein [Chitinophaga nivalis]MCW3486187.1 hypothetical protein [Chitinophaga nivalis]
MATTFRTFVLGNPLYRTYLLYGTGIMIIGLILFKLLYPFPDFFTDSFYYVWVAGHQWEYFVRPLGYSGFLQLVHLFTHSATALVILQYLLLQACSWYLLFTVLYIFRLPDNVAKILLTCVIACPLPYYLANLVASDGLFIILSMYWFTLLLWIVYQPRLWQLLLQAVVLGAVFCVRYNALYYPLVLLAALLLSHTSLRQKAATLGFSLLLLGGVIWQLQRVYDTHTGIRTISNYSGWQMANNALYMYPHIQVVPTDFSDPVSQQLDHMVKTYFDTTGLAQHNHTPRDGAQFMIDIFGPLKAYYRQLASEPPRTSIQAFGQADQAHGRYGRTLIMQHPVPFIRYFVLPNATVYLFPPEEQFGLYAEGRTTVPDEVAAWFGWPDSNISCRFPQLQHMLFIFFPILFLLLHLFVLPATFIFYRSGIYRKLSLAQHRTLILLALMLLFNAGFSILASPVVLRYQLLPLLLLFYVAAVIATTTPVITQFLIRISKSGE